MTQQMQQAKDEFLREIERFLRPNEQVCIRLHQNETRCTLSCFFYLLILAQVKRNHRIHAITLILPYLDNSVDKLGKGYSKAVSVWWPSFPQAAYIPLFLTHKLSSRPKKARICGLFHTLAIGCRYNTPKRLAKSSAFIQPGIKAPSVVTIAGVPLTPMARPS